MLAAVPACGASGARTAFSPGQEWTYRIDGHESDQTLVILRSGPRADGGTAFDVQVKSFPPPGGSASPLVFRISHEALERSVVRLVGENRQTPLLAGLGTWDERAWVFDTSIEDARRLSQAGMAGSHHASCDVDRERLLALDQQAFDQDLNGGWRILAARPNCSAAAADLIRDYRKRHKNESAILIWHEGQMRADAGETAEAIALFERSRSASAFVMPGWNEYVDATIAFLKGDREAFDAARAALAAIPRPPGLDLKDPAGKPLEWPPNLNVVDQLGRCFGMSYREAYGVCPK